MLIKIVPWQVTRKWLPPIFLIKFIFSTMFLTIELWIYERTCWRIIERIWSVVHPFSIENVTRSCGVTGFKTCLITERVKKICFCLVGKQKQSKKQSMKQSMKQSIYKNRTHFLSFRSQPTIFLERNKGLRVKINFHIIMFLYNNVSAKRTRERERTEHF